MDDTAVQPVRQDQEARPHSAQKVPSHAPAPAFFPLTAAGALRYNDHEMVYTLLKCTAS